MLGKLFSVVAVISLATLTVSRAQEQDYSGVYFCTKDAGGGLGYNETTNSWEGRTLRSDRKFIFKLSLAPQEGDRMNLYEATVGEVGRPLASCRYFHGDDPRVSVSPYAECYSLGSIFGFNPMLLRFQEAYLVGYIQGLDSTDDTPGLMGGSCTKID